MLELEGFIEFEPAFRTTAQVNVTPKEGFSLGEALESVYPLLGLVFDYLGYKDLERVSLVNSTWKTEAEKEMKKRINVAGWLTVYRESEEKSCVDASTNFGFQRVQYIISFNTRYFRKTNHDFVSQLDANVGCCNFYSPDVYSFYPKNCINPMTKFSIADVCLFPIIPNIRVATVCIPPTQLTDDVFDKSPNERIKCVLVFQFSEPSSLDFITPDQINEGVFMEKNYPDCAFGGGFTPRSIEYRYVNGTDNKYTTTNCFSIGFIENTDGKNNNFDAASFIIGEEVDYFDDFEQTLIQFKRKITIREHSLAFRFSSSVETALAQEAVIFSKIFPETLQYGVHVISLIGCNTKHFCEDGTALPQTKKRCPLVDVVQYSSTGVIVFLTWGRIIT